jgi:hypothetical protein
MPRPRRIVIEPPRPPEGAVRLPDHIRTKPVLTPKEAGDALGMPAKQVLVLPGLVRVQVSAQKVGYMPTDLEEYLNKRRVMQGFATTALGSFLADLRRPMSATALSQVLRIRRQAVRDILGDAPYLPADVFAFFAQARSVQLAA